MNMHVKKWAAALASALSALILATVVAVPAQADTGATSVAPSPTTVTVTAPLTIDCSTLTEAGREYAVSHNVDLCGVLSGAKTSGGASPNNTVYGDCGSASISMSSSGFGNAMIVWSLHSTLGWILWYGVTVTYSGSTNAGAVPFTGIPVNIDAGDYTNPHTGSGYASAFLSGTVETVLADCTINYPTASAYI